MDGISLNQFADKLKNLIKDGDITRENFEKNIDKNLSIFQQLDLDGDGKISEDEVDTLLNADSNGDGIISSNELYGLRQAVYFAKRNIDKWFSIDINRDGHWSNVEDKLADTRMADENDTSLLAAKTNEQLAKIYNLEEVIDDTIKLEDWINDWSQYIKNNIEEQYHIELNDSQMYFLKDQMIKQLNTWLLKEGGNATCDAPLYNSCNITAYTRLITDEETISCCGGDISKPPMGPQNPDEGCAKIFSSMETENSVNSANEVKNRLAWAMFKCVTQEEVSKMTPLEYRQYQEDWQQVRDMTADDFRELLKPGNEKRRERFEKNSQMTVAQIVQYIDIVESEIGEGRFDSNDWKIDILQFNRICKKVNGTYGDEQRLIGKTRADIPENRQDLLRFLEEKGWLYDQFK